MSAQRPLPRLNNDNRAFWTGGAKKELLIVRCGDCAGYTQPPRPICRHCLSERVAPEAVAQTAVVDSFTINYQQWYPGLEVPYVIARVALEGAPGVILTTNIVGSPIEAVKIGDRVRVTFLQQGEIFLPLFEKVE